MRYIRNDAEIASELFDDGIVIINFLTGRYFTLNPTGEQIWQRLADPADIIDLARLFASADDDGATKTQIEDFLGLLREQRLIATTEAAAPADLTVSASKMGFEKPALHVFDDLSELILLDPIHEVNENLGWPVAPAMAGDDTRG